MLKKTTVLSEVPDGAQVTVRFCDGTYTGPVERTLQGEHFFMGYPIVPTPATEYDEDGVTLVSAMYEVPVTEPQNLGAVVRDEYGYSWVRIRTGEGEVWHNSHLSRRRWKDLSMPEVLSEGVDIYGLV